MHVIFSLQLTRELLRHVVRVLIHEWMISAASARASRSVSIKEAVTDNVGVSEV